ncbi:hypothetical protein IJ847_01925 [Candidatus Saccharibacteria bacterium]|nr:hypothetical protein [Candidatus Saccharibacteria bacterium]
MSPNGGDGQEAGQPKLSRLGGAIRPPEKFIRSAGDVLRGAAQATTESVEKAEPEKAAPAVAADLAFARSLSLEIAADAGQATEKNEVAKPDVAPVVEPAEKKTAEEPVVVPVPEPEEKAVDEEKAAAVVPAANIEMPKRCFHPNNSSVQTNWSDVVKVNKHSEARHESAQRLIRVAGARMGRRLDVDYSEKINLSSTKFERPFVLHFVSAREEEIRHRIEREQEIKEEIQEKLVEKPLEISKADVEESKKIIPEDTHSTKEMEAYPIDGERQPLKKSAIFGIIGVVALAVIGVVVSFLMGGMNKGETEENSIWADFVSGKNGVVSMNGVSTVLSGENSETTQFELDWDAEKSKLRIMREGLDYSVFDDGNVSFWFDDLTANKKVALSRKVFEDVYAEGTEKPVFVENATSELSKVWILTDNDSLRNILNDVDEEYSKEADCLSFLNKDLRYGLADLGFLKKIDATADFTISYDATEWSKMLNDLPYSDKKNAFVKCWDGYSLKMSGKTINGAIGDLNLDFEAEGKAVKLEMKASAESRLKQDGRKAKYADVMAALRNKLKDSRLRASESSIKVACVNLQTDCAKSMIQDLSEKTDEISDSYFLYLFGVRNK